MVRSARPTSAGSYSVMCVCTGVNERTYALAVGRQRQTEPRRCLKPRVRLADPVR